MSRSAQRIMDQSAEIVARLRKTPATVREVCREYRCSYSTLRRAIAREISEAAYAKIVKKKRGGCSGVRFKKGHVPWNKGVRYLHLSPSTQFVRGGPLRGQAARLWRSVGSITIRRDKTPRSRRDRANAAKGPPRRWIKVRDDGQRSKRWMPYARHVWESFHGSVPPGFLVVHADGDTMNDDPKNLLLVDRRTNLNRLRYMQPEAIERAKKNAGITNAQRHRLRRELRQAGVSLMPWECPACGADYEKQPDRCIKCGSVTVTRANGRYHDFGNKKPN